MPEEEQQDLGCSKREVISMLLYDCVVDLQQIIKKLDEIDKRIHKELYGTERPEWRSLLK